MERENVFTNLSAFALGGLAGAAFALLYAPGSGEETRRAMRDQIRRGAEKGRETLQQGAEYGRQIVQQVRGKGEELAEEAMAFAEAQGADVGSFGERRRKARAGSSEIPEPV